MIHFIIGTEAELIKVFPLMIKLRDDGVDYNFISTGQHNLSRNEILSLFKLKNPDFVMYKGERFTSFFKIIIWFLRTFFMHFFSAKKIFKGDNRGVVIVHGDTLSTMLGALVAKFQGMTLAHLESGLRSNDLTNPFPEEFVRRIVSYFADICFCPGDWACHNLGAKNKIDMKQNTLIDSYALIQKLLNKKRVRGDYMLLVLHRTENLSNESLVKHVATRIVEWSKTIKVIFVMHHTTEHVFKSLNLYSNLRKMKNVKLLPRQSYLDFVSLLQNAKLVMTDGGSNQEECFYIGVPTLLLRKNTERKEGLGRNVILSKWNFKIIDKFFENYKKYRFSSVKTKNSPSEVVLDNVKIYS